MYKLKKGHTIVKKGLPGGMIEAKDKDRELTADEVKEIERNIPHFEKSGKIEKAASKKVEEKSTEKPSASKPNK